MSSTERLPEGSSEMPTVAQSGASTHVPSDASQPHAAPRENVIETAMRFLQNPKVRSSPLAQKKMFLQKKGLTDQEIEIAVERSGTRQDVDAAVASASTPSNQVAIPAQGGYVQQQQMVPYGQPVPSRWSKWRDYLAVAVIVSGLGYGAYKLVQNFLMPLLKGRQEEKERLDRLEASIQELNQSVSLTVGKLETAVTSIQNLLEQQQAKLDSLTASAATNRAIASHSKTNEITEVKAEIVSLKGLLLNRHQFPATPQPAPIPSWQRIASTNDATPTKPSQSPPLSPPQITDAASASSIAQSASEAGSSEGTDQSEEPVMIEDVNIHETDGAGDGNKDESAV